MRKLITAVMATITILAFAAPVQAANKSKALNAQASVRPQGGDRCSFTACVQRGTSRGNTSTEASNWCSRNHNGC